MSKISISGLKREVYFSNFALYSKSCYFSITRCRILIFLNILHLEKDFETFIIYHKVFGKSLIKKHK